MKEKSKFGKAMYKLVWGEGTELGDCIFYTIFTLAILTLIWLVTFEKWFGFHIGFVLIPWAAVVVLIWREFTKTGRKKKSAKAARQQRDIQKT